MTGWKRLVYYLFLNVLVSACATWTALSLWARWHPCPQATLPATVVAPVLTPLVPTATPPPMFVYEVQPGDTLSGLAERFGVAEDTLRRLNSLPDDTLGVGQRLLIPGTPPPDWHPPGDPQALRLVEVIGPGRLEEERVVLRYDGEGTLDLTGWRLEDGRGAVFVFPALALRAGGAVQVWTKAGPNTAAELFWGRERAVWRSGTVLTLRDARGQVILTYSVP